MLFFSEVSEMGIFRGFLQHSTLYDDFSEKVLDQYLSLPKIQKYDIVIIENVELDPFSSHVPTFIK